MRSMFSLHSFDVAKVEKHFMKKHVFSKVSFKLFSAKCQTIATKTIVNRTYFYVLSNFQILVTKGGSINDTKAFVLDKMGPICHIMVEKILKLYF
jgi:hypothetical protein